MPVVMNVGLIRTKDTILLGLKKRGFGANRWNGFGGKVHEGETVEAALIREYKEECDITVTALKKYGVITFIFEDSGKQMEVHFYEVTSYTGTPIETEEMRPQWFAIKDIPYADMWPDDKFWLPLFLAGKKFKGTIHFKDQNTIRETTLVEVQKLD